MRAMTRINPSDTIDDIDARLLLALADDPRATVVSLAHTAGISRNTAQARLERFDQRETLGSFELRIPPAALGCPLTSFITVTVVQRKLDAVSAAMSEIHEVLEVFGISGAVDLLVRVATRDADDLYRVAGRILATPGVERTQTALVMRSLVDYRVRPLLEQHLRT